MKLIRKIFKVKRKMTDELGQDDWKKLVQREERNEIIWFIMVCITCAIFVGIFLVYFK
jgi:hypothetical protein|tara:strand:+ start:73 stop:246 length:174 start_codon:yes stop_codon:yes gene_type:complete